MPRNGASAPTCTRVRLSSSITVYGSSIGVTTGVMRGGASWAETPSTSPVSTRRSGRSRPGRNRTRPASRLLVPLARRSMGGSTALGKIFARICPWSQHGGFGTKRTWLCKHPGQEHQCAQHKAGERCLQQCALDVSMAATSTLHAGATSYHTDRGSRARLQKMPSWCPNVVWADCVLQGWPCHFTQNAPIWVHAPSSSTPPCFYFR